MKQKINYLEYILNLNLGILPEHYFDRIKEWIGGDKEKIKFTMTFKLLTNSGNYNRYREAIKINYPQIFIFITENMSVFGSYCSNYKTSGGWIKDPNAFLFSLNLNKKYPAKIAKKNYHCSYGEYNFNELKLHLLENRVGEFDKTGTYLDNYELEGNSKYFQVKHFMVYKVEYINENNDCYTKK